MVTAVSGHVITGLRRKSFTIRVANGGNNLIEAMEEAKSLRDFKGRPASETVSV